TGHSRWLRAADPRRAGGRRRNRGLDEGLAELKDADITILGAGPVGSALALLLARTSPDPARIVLCHAWRGSRPATSGDDSTAPAAGNGGPDSSPEPTRGPDPRSLALNHGSRVLLEGL